MSIGTTLTYQLPDGWTLRKVAATMVREWLPPFRAEPPAKAARWVIQSVMEEIQKDQPPLWEAGISTEEYEERLDRAELRWLIRASAGRGKGTVLARFSPCSEPGCFELVCGESTLPDNLFDNEKVDQFLKEHETEGVPGLFATLLANNGFEPVN